MNSSVPTSWMSTTPEGADQVEREKDAGDGDQQAEFGKAWRRGREGQAGREFQPRKGEGGGQADDRGYAVTTRAARCW
jgi:hypothetical protein